MALLHSVSECCCNRSNDNAICESFLWFTPVDESSGKVLTNAGVKFLQKKTFELKQYTGQGYVNAANPTGKTSCVQDYFTSKFIGVFMSRGRHNLNVLGDATISSVKSVLCLVS